MAPATAAMAKYTIDEVAEHNLPRDLWIVIDKKVYDVTAFRKQHPGGAAVLLQMAGRDATDAANAAHKTSLPAARMKEFLIGDLVGGSHPQNASAAVQGSKAKLTTAADGTLEYGAKNASSSINAQSFEELVLDAATVEQVQASWSAFLTAAGSHEHAGEALYEGILDGNPTLQGLFRTPRSVQASRFVTSLDGLVSQLGSPAQLKALVGSLAFGHLNQEVTEPRASSFRDSILGVLSNEIDEGFTASARSGWLFLLNYVGGAIVYTRVHCADRLQTLTESWRKANAKDDSGRPMGSLELEDRKRVSVKSSKPIREAPPAPAAGGEEASAGDAAAQLREAGLGTTAKRTTFNEMFEVNAAVMGFRASSWMREVLASFDAIVTNAADSPRLQEECDVLVLRIGKRTQGPVNLSEYKACMLASLRSLLPQDWNNAHEIAWNWLWENVEHLLQRQLGRPEVLGRALEKLMGGLDEAKRYEMGQDIYAHFFEAAPVAQEHLKQSDTRLLFIVDQVNQMTLRLFHEPWTIVDETSALGLRHVGYGVPVDLVRPFVNAYVHVMTGAAEEVATAAEAYRWSLGLLARVLVRTISEGSTVVMKAVNANSERMLRKAIGSAPRGQRSQWLLRVEAGSQSISPLQWAIESGCIDAAHAIFRDLLAIRADRERYYYGVDDLFARHPDIVRTLCAEAPQLLPTLLEGLVWRSNQLDGRQRRVNYYIKHLVVNPDGSFSPNLQWMVECGDPKIQAHEVVVLVSDTMWNGIAYRQFVLSKASLIVSLANFMVSQAIIPKLAAYQGSQVLCIIVLVGRCFNYLVTLPHLAFVNGRRSAQEYRQKATMKVLRCIRVPQYLSDPFDTGSVCFALLLLLMLMHEPMLHCLGQEDVSWPTAACEAADGVRFRYSAFSMLAMILHWFLLIDLAVFSTGLSIFLLVIRQVLSEIWRFIFALVFLLLTFGSAVSVLDHTYYEMRDIPRSVVALFAISLKLYEDDYRDLQFEPALLGAVFMFVTCSVIILLNLLVAQLNCSYVFIYQDMVGFARLNRAKLIVEMMETTPEAQWDKFVASLRFDQPLEFHEGDVGLAGGLQVKEAASLHPVVAETIFRFGGSISPEMPWPEEEAGQEEELDKYHRLELLVHKTLRRIVRQNQKLQKKAGGLSEDRKFDVSG